MRVLEFFSFTNVSLKKLKLQLFYGMKGVYECLKLLRSACNGETLTFRNVDVVITLKFNLQ
jgi:hypothetical protein